MGEVVIAKYIRLSVEDAKTDSMSIDSQRLMLDRHIEEMRIPGAIIMEFVDNGYSGTNFERPAVQELLELVRQGKVNCIIVKDLSRFGRNMIETGYYLERVFPLYRVRFISLSDDYDSAEHEGDTGGMEISFKYLIHEQYSRDLSRKIKTAKRQRALRGEYVIKNCAFGFKKVGNHLEIDEPAAEIVRLIYNLAASGQSLVGIVSRLYADKHPTPSEYKKFGKKILAKDFEYLWNKSQVLSILSDEQYIGTYVAGKTRATEVGSGKTVKVDESDWIRIPNHHPAIVSKALFDAARKKIDEKGEPLRKRKIGTWERYKHIRSPLQGKVFCGCCGHTMRLSSTRNAAFHCDFTRAAPDAACYRHKRLKSELEASILKLIRSQAGNFLRGMREPSSCSEPQTGSVTQIEDEKRGLYERFVLGEISADEYRESKTALDADVERITQAQAVSLRESSNKIASNTLRKMAEDALKARKLTEELADAFIQNVKVHPDSRIDIGWKIEG